MSFLFGSSDNKATEPPKPFGTDTARASTNQQARPVPYFAGKVRVALTWLCGPFNTHNDPVESTEGKESIVTGYNYFTSIAGLVCMGPVDALYAIYMNGDLLWGAKPPYTTAALQRGVTDYADLTIRNQLGGLDRARIYWGTEAQGADPTLATSPNQHPYYRGFCYIVFKDLWLGYNQTNVQNIEVVVGRWPQPSWLTPAAQLNGECNPIAFLGDLAQHPRAGLQLNDAFLDTTVLNASATRLRDEAFVFSPFLNRAQEFKQVLLQSCEHFDGFAIGTTEGKFAVKLTRPPAVTDVLPVVELADMASRPEFSPEDWSTVQTQATVNYTNAKIGLQSDSTPVWRDGAARLINNGVDPLVMERPWITNDKVAKEVAKAAGQLSALPSCPGKVKLFKKGTLWDDLQPGALFKFDYPQRTVAAMIFRVTERRQSNPAKPQFDISFIADFSYLYPAVGGITALPDAGNREEAPAPADFQFVRIVELPLALCPSGKLSLAVLAARSQTTLAGFNVFLARNVNDEVLDSYVQLETVMRFAQHGILAEEFLVTRPMIDQAIGLVVQLDGVDLSLPEQTLFDAFSDTYLIFIDGEIFSMISAEIISEHTYRIYVVRSRFATARETHGVGSDVFIVAKSAITALQHPQLAVNNSSTLKLQPFSKEAFIDLADVEPRELFITGFMFEQFLPANLRVNGMLNESTYAAGGEVVIKWTLTDPGRELYEPHLYKRYTYFEFYDTSVSLLARYVAPEGVDTLTLSNAALIALLGGEVDFQVVAGTKISTDLFDYYTNAVENNVTKV